MKKRSYLLLFLMLTMPVLSYAQNTNTGKKGAEPYKKSAILKAYRGYMKEKNYGKARKEIEDAMLKHEAAANDALFYKYKVDALNELIGAENRKIYLNSKPDTTSFFNYIYDLYVAGLKGDSVEQKSILEKRDLGKKAEPKLRYGFGAMMMPYRKNLLNAGKYYYKKRDYSNAFRFLDMYAQTKEAAVFEDKKENSTVADPDDIQEVSTLAVLSAYASSKHEGVMTYLSESLKDEELKPKLLEIGSKSAGELGDTIEMTRILEQGFTEYPEVDYFFMTLMKYYNDHEMYEAALKKALWMAELYALKRDYWFMAGKEQMLLGQYSDALISFGKCVDIKADDAESFSAIGNIYLHEAHEAYSSFNVPLSAPDYASKKAVIDNLYKQSCAAFEKARKFDENNRDLWLSGLREAYFKLNKGRELRLLEKYK